MKKILVNNDKLKFKELNFYWRVSNSPNPHPNIPSRLPISLGYSKKLGLIKQLPNQKTLDALKKVYSLNFNIGYLQEGFSFQKGYLVSIKEFIYKIVKFKKNMTIFEIGCGGAALLSEFKEKGYSVSGIDPSPIAKKACDKLGINIIQDFYSKEKVSAFDFIFHHNVLEHVENPLKLLRHNYYNLNEKGQIVIAVPDCTYYINHGDISMVWHEHISYFDDESLRNILIKAGFTDVVIKKSSYGGLLYGYGIKAKKNHHEQVFIENENKFKDFVNSTLIKFKNVSKLLNKILITEKSDLGIYVPLRFISYLSLMDLEKEYLNKIRFFDDDSSSIGKYYDGFSIKIESFKDFKKKPPNNVIICSDKFFDQIFSKISLIMKNKSQIYSLKKI